MNIFLPENNEAAEDDYERDVRNEINQFWENCDANDREGWEHNLIKSFED